MPNQLPDPSPRITMNSSGEGVGETPTPPCAKYRPQKIWENIYEDPPHSTHCNPEKRGNNY